MCSLVLRRFELELSPSSWDELAPLDTPLEIGTQSYKSSGVSSQHDGTRRLVEVGTSGTIAIPEVGKEVIGTVLGRLVGQNDAWLSVVGITDCLRLGRRDMGLWIDSYSGHHMEWMLEGVWKKGSVLDLALLMFYRRSGQ